MKTGRSLIDIAKELERQADTKADFVAPTERLFAKALGDDVVVELADKGDYPLTRHAHRQVGDRLGIPAKYYDRMAESAPPLLAMNVNHWFRAEPDRRLVRTLDGKIRAFLSDRYRPMDNFDLAEAVLPRLRDSGAVVHSCEITDSRLYIKAVMDAHPGAEIPPVGVENWQWGKDHHSIDVLKPGISISNSEVGSGALSIGPCSWTKRCSNLAVFKADAMRKSHLGRVLGNDGDDLYEHFSDATRDISDRALWAQVADLVTAALDGSIFDKIVEQVRRSRGIIIDADPAEVVEVFAKRQCLTDDERGGVLKHLVAGGELTQYGLSNAITAASQEVESYDRASDLERLGGQIIELPKAKFYETIAIAA